MREIFEKHTPTLVVVALVAVASLFFRHYWNDAAKAQSAGGFLSFVAAAILIGVTWEYVRINQKTLALQQSQWEQQNRVVLRFGIKRYRGKAQLWVANIGRTDFLVCELVIRQKGTQELARNERRVVASGSRETMALPEQLWKGQSLFSVFDLRLLYDSVNESGTTSAKAFTLVIDTNDEVAKIRRGIDNVWPVKCPKCEQTAAVMITEHLENFDDAAIRQHEMEGELRVSCPDHYSKWMDSVDQLRHRRAARGPDGLTED